MQLGAYATFSGLSEADVAAYAARGLRVEARPPVAGFEWDARQYRRAVEAANHLRPDLVVVGGDMVDDPNAEDQYAEYMRITRRLDRDIPMRWVPGNHDIAPDTVVPTPDSLARYRQAFGPDYFAFDHGPVRFVALDTAVLGHPEQVPGEGEAQLAFLAEELARAEQQGQPAILLGHHPLFTRRPDEEDDYWNLPAQPRRLILDLVHRHRVPLALAGHWHRNAVVRDGTFEMVTTGAVGVPLGDDPSGFRMVEVDEGRFTHYYLPLDL